MVSGALRVAARGPPSGGRGCRLRLQGPPPPWELYFLSTTSRLRAHQSHARAALPHTGPRHVHGAVDSISIKGPCRKAALPWHCTSLCTALGRKLDTHFTVMVRLGGEGRWEALGRSGHAAQPAPCVLRWLQAQSPSVLGAVDTVPCASLGTWGWSRGAGHT